MVKSLKDNKGFTLLELMIVVAIIGILATLAQPMFKTAVLKSREAALKEDLFNIRNVLDQYYADNGKYPDSLSDLVAKGYMRGIPVDPFTGANDSWRLEFYVSESGEESSGGIFDVHSASNEVGLNGKPYSEW
jgi:general secretion pathway protein G